MDAHPWRLAIIESTLWQTIKIRVKSDFMERNVMHSSSLTAVAHRFLVCDYARVLGVCDAYLSFPFMRGIARRYYQEWGWEGRGGGGGKKRLDTARAKLCFCAAD